MRDDELRILEQYDIDVRNTRKVRGAILCDTAQGPFLLREMQFSEKRMLTLDRLINHLREQGIGNIDWILKDREEQLFAISEDGTKYFLTRWFHGRECDIHRESDLLEAARNLTRIHGALEGLYIEGLQEGENLQEEFYRHNREIKKVRTFMRDKVTKGDFELTFLKHFDTMYGCATCALEQLKASHYMELLEISRQRHQMIHGDYNYHNIIMLHDGIATTNFGHARQDLQVVDLYYFLRKVMEKHHWNVVLGDKILNEYQKIRPVTKEETEFLAICIAYPEKFWKAANSYYRSRKVWIPAKNLEKLEMVIRQTEEKKAFLKTIFSFHF